MLDASGCLETCLQTLPASHTSLSGVHSTERVPMLINARVVRHRGAPADFSGAGAGRGVELPSAGRRTTPGEESRDIRDDSNEPALLPAYGSESASDRCSTGASRRGQSR